ncbi:hypothetical protein B0H16DRAFT_1424563 [Mycena metata]|uniref:Uncharacterized protein n=1 Tax=Mycena metata TaxID=1033252 RepID=A0AAD7IDS9_9AGAR|nr:hypothetical protein B0H16DRAFT_1424563 [Mycena metata]
MCAVLKSRSSDLKFEFVAGDTVRFLADLNSGSPSMDWRKGSSVSFTRAWMSNVPDYAGGILEMALYAVPCLQSADIASVGMNCLFNGPAWRNNMEDSVYTYTLLLPDQLPQYLGCTCVGIETLHPPFCLLPCELPLKPSQLAHREDFERWLHRVLVRILAPPHTAANPGYCILLPTTLRTFVQLLLRTIEVGYQPSWISDLLSSILADSLHSSCRPYQTTPLPAHTIASPRPLAKLQLSSWMADVEGVLAAALPILPRGLDFSSACLNIADTAIFRATVHSVHPGQSYNRNPGLALIFCAPGFNPTRSAFTTHKVLLSETPQGGDVQIFYSILRCDIDVCTRTGTVSWRMSIARVEKMQQAGWILYLWQADGPFVGKSLANTLRF